MDEPGDSVDSPSLPTADDFHAVPEHFQCAVCLDLLYKPIVLVCGHISCFWCVHRAMNNFGESHCAMCRQPFKYFPSICPLLHHLLMKMELKAYQRRQKEVLEEEARYDCFSPQFVGSLVEKEPDSIWMEKELLVSDVSCPACKEILFRPAVLNCGHVYCESCLVPEPGEVITCQFCESVHPGDLPKVCLDLYFFLEKQFPKEYAQRSNLLQSRQLQLQNGCQSSRVMPTDQSKKGSGSLILWHPRNGNIILHDLFVHVGVGCDTCGMYPISGKRFKCKDCKEAIGFDQCETCYNSSSKQPGRFNQQHTPDHTLVLDDSQLLANIIKSEIQIEDQQDHLDSVPDETSGDDPTTR